ncbi:glycosyltransferase family 4 protein [Solihabitans fulvus]|uniref:glycosyltransferase family 4 protein n=1 Tax=Solihabitans fulvus TaxID=1892852 RepID=UPI001CB762A4|nr:glycosyltransferase family 4 protein [Solihabitans fulvus]
MSDCFLPRLGGIEVQVAGLAKAQAAAGHQVAVITATPPGDHPPDPDVPVHHVIANLPYELPVHPRAGRHLTRLYRTIAPDVVHVHVGAVSPFGWAAVRAAVRSGLPTVVTVHSMWGAASRALYRALEATLRWCEWPVVTTAVSEAAAMLIRQASAGRADVRVVPNGIDLEGWRQRGDNTRAVERGQVHVIAVGRLAPRKQPMTLLRMLRRARQRIPADIELRLTVAGDGPARAGMQRYLRKHRMTGWVELAGRLDRTEVHDLLATADLFIAPAKLESFGLAALEARIAGLPVIGRTSGGITEFVRPGKEGILCDTFGELVDAVVELATDHGLRERVTEHNRAVLPTHCDWPSVIESLDGCYALARRRRPSWSAVPGRRGRQLAAGGR